MTLLAGELERFSLFGRRTPRRPPRLDEVPPQPLPDPSLEMRAAQIAERTAKRVAHSTKIAKDIEDLIQAYLKRYA